MRIASTIAKERSALTRASIMATRDSPLPRDRPPSFLNTLAPVVCVTSTASRSSKYLPVGHTLRPHRCHGHAMVPRKGRPSRDPTLATERGHGKQEFEISPKPPESRLQVSRERVSALPRARITLLILHHAPCRFDGRWGFLSGGEK